MKFYIASKLENHAQVKRLASLLKQFGWTHTYDWTAHGSVKETDRETLKAVGQQEYDGVKAADIVIVLTPQGRGTHVELGMAIALNKLVCICHKDETYFQCDDNTSAFYWLPNVRHFAGNMEALAEQLRSTQLPSGHEIAESIGISSAEIPDKIEYALLESTKEDGCTRQRIQYDSFGDKVSAYLLIPDVVGSSPAILINHQHNSEWHLGKSEVCGLAGNPLQAFEFALAQKGIVVLAPDSICFEDRRKNGQGITPLPGDADFMQHFNALCYSIVQGDNLMQTVLRDAMNGISLLASLPYVDSKKIGTMGHSYGGNTVLFLAAADERIAFGCASGSACTYANRMENNVGIEMASVIPGFHQKFDMDDLLRCIAPRPMLVVSAQEDKYSKDAPYTVEKARPAYAQYGAESQLYHKRYPGGHGLTEERFADIVAWLEKQAKICNAAKPERK